MYQSIIHATDLADNHFELCKKAQAIAKRFSADFHLLHAITTPASIQWAQGLGFTEIEPPEGLLEDAKIVMSTLGDSLKISTKYQHLDIGPLSTIVANAVNTLQCGLLIIGHHTHNNWLRLLLDNNLESLALSVQCDVMTIS